MTTFHVATRWGAVTTAVPLVLLLATQSVAEVERIDIRRREVVADGRSFGLTGPYEKLVGRVWFTLDPEHPANAEIVDLDAAATDGTVTFAADLYVLRPVRAGRGNGTLLLEVPNRGGKGQVWFFDRGAGRSLDPTSAADFGDALLLRQGFTLAWLGWQWDVPEREGLLRLYPARAMGLEGLVRADRVFARREQVLALGDRDHTAYPVADPADGRNRLTVRDTRLGQRVEIPRSQWRFARLGRNGAVIPDHRAIYLEAGFEPGRIYEAVYVAENPAVVGLGLAATRDLVSHLKYAGDEIRVDRTLGFGISQSGRFLRHLIYQGFNRDEEGRRVFDGIWSHVAGGGRGSFNHRFGQASRDAHSFSAFFFPTDLFPFSGADQLDPVSGLEDGLFSRLDVEDPPKIFFTNSSYEYWGRAASLIHTDLDGRRDLSPEPFVRIWGFAGMQHYTDAFPPRASGTRYRANPSVVQ